MKLFVRNLPYDLKENVLRELFEKHGSVVSARIVTDKYTGRSKGFGFVEMSNAEEGKVVIEKLNGFSVNGRSIFVDQAREGGGERREERGSSREGSYGRRNEGEGRYGRREEGNREYRRG